MRDSSEGYNPFALPNVFSRPQRILYLVVFKCSRADIYYIPENTGLQVKTGDTVIVEGDRGQDLGTVEAINITMDMAKKLKEEYLRKQYKCLMMFSRMYPHIATIANDDEQFEQAIIASKNMQQNGMHGGTPQQESEPRPKMIKRVARPDEVHLLREKEGNEAKAKRVCQTKVNDHGLRMEILDAEFQQ
jgi:cell fate regulator YaaT (PSP1 superfamily)